MRHTTRRVQVDRNAHCTIVYQVDITQIQIVTSRVIRKQLICFNLLTESFLIIMYQKQNVCSASVRFYINYFEP